MLGDERYDIDQILSAIDFLKFKGAPSYSLERMLKAISSATGSEHGSWSAKDWAKDRNVLIIGSGPSIEHHIDDITKYTKEENPIVFCLNINKFVPENIVNAYVACHETRISMEADLYSGLTKPIILPMSRIPKEMKELLSGVDILDYGLRVEEHKFQIFDNGCVLDSPLALMYALSLTIASGAKKILLAGIDGYDRYDQRQQNIANLFLKYKGLDESIPIFAITPTTFEIDQNIVGDKR
jgi:4-hydroxy 2-oxovalerate aldolase